MKKIKDFFSLGCLKSDNGKKNKDKESAFNVKPVSQTSGSRLTPLAGSPSGHIYDICAYVMICGKHNRIGLSQEDITGFLWLPFVALSTTAKWAVGSADGANLVLANGDEQKFVALKANPVITESVCMQLFRLQLPQTQQFNTRLICYVKINKTSPSYKCCSDTTRLKWFPIEDVKANKVGPLWGPEVHSYLCSSERPIVQQIDEYSLDQALFYVPRDPPRNLEEELLKSTNYTEKDVERIYRDFIEHCFPAFYMTVHSFSDYMMKYGFEKREKKLKHLFRAFNFHNTGFLSFSEFLIGLTSIEPNAYNGQSRIKLVFKYFDVDLDGFLSKEEFEQMVRDINANNKSGKQLNAEQCMKTIGFQRNGIAFDDFFKACGSHKFRGTSSLCRSSRSIVSCISRSMASRSIRHVKKEIDSGLGSFLKDRKYSGVCNSCKEKRFDYSFNIVSLNKEGRCVDARPLPEWKNKVLERKSETSLKEESKSSSSKELKRMKSSTSSLNLMGISRDKFSTDIVWNPKSVANYFIEQIRAFNMKKGSHKDNKGLLNSSAEKETFVKKVKQLCNEVEKIVAQEERCVVMSSPVIVVGDIHGNIEDLMTMERVLWKSFPIVSSNLLFLGDYVDRGKWGLECALYILCMKLLAPNKVVVLRGNHEVRDLQKHYTYRKECCDKYGDSLGAQIWEVTNRVFDKLAICAIVDDAIFCAHGGIPCTTRQIEKINDIKTDLKDPERESAIAWEILWSDPIGAQQYSETADLLQIRVESAKGFLTNTKRGTAFLFAEEAANNFLQNNGLTHIVRAHEVPAQGFAFHFGNKCTTIFSSSHYCGNDNHAACVHIDNERLRIVRLDTVNNAPAS